jgi:hypothetical protein
MAIYQGNERGKHLPTYKVANLITYLLTYNTYPLKLGRS